MVSVDGYTRKRLGWIRQLAISKGCSVSYGMPRKDGVVEEVTGDGRVKLVGVVRLLEPGLIFGTSLLQQDGS